MIPESLRRNLSAKELEFFKLYDNTLGPYLRKMNLKSRPQGLMQLKKVFFVKE